MRCHPAVVIHPQPLPLARRLLYPDVVRNEAAGPSGALSDREATVCVSARRFGGLPRRLLGANHAELLFVLLVEAFCIKVSTSTPKR